MAINFHLVGFVAMALAILAILTVGTLLAADLIHPGRRKPVPRSPRTTGRLQQEESTSRRSEPRV